MSLFSMNDKGDGNKYAVIPDVKGLEDGQKQLKDSQKQLENKHDGDVQAMQELLEEMSAFAVGDIKWSSADLTQAGFLVANGAEVGRATYPDLCAVYEAMGFPWGAGDGSTTFNLPNLIGKFPEGADSAGGYKEAGLPNITGKFIPRTFSDYASRLTEGAFWGQTSDRNQTSANGTIEGSDFIYFDASRSNPIYGNSTTVQPPSALLIPYVKAFNGASSSSTDLEITQVANEVAEKANRDLSNLSEKGRKSFFPSSTYKVLDDVPYIAGAKGEIIVTPPANGYIQAVGKIAPNRGKSQIHYIYIAQAGRIQALEQEKVSTHGLGILFPVLKGVPCSISAMDMGASVVFYYAEGEV